MNGSKNRQTIRRFAMIVNALIILAMMWSVFAPTTAASAAACKFKHKVQPGETLIYIGQLYQFDWREIAKANDIKEPYVLTGGQVLCIPGGTKPADTTTTTTVVTEEGTTTTATTKKEPSMTAGVSMNSVYIKVEGFPKNTTYYVNIPDLFKYVPRTANEAQVTQQVEDLKSKMPVVRIGRIRTDKNGFWEGWFRIPFEVNQTANMRVCLKNVLNDNLSCNDFVNPHYTYSFSEKVEFTGGWAMIPRSCAKWGR